MFEIYCAVHAVKMRPLINGVAVLDTLEDGTPYCLKSSDLLECPICKTQAVLTNVESFSRHHSTDFNQLVDYYRQEKRLIERKQS